ncbi:MAG: peptidyl-prolyl cis-trans isomerase [Gammaproteobacteria bacterium]
MDKETRMLSTVKPYGLGALLLITVLAAHAQYALAVEAPKSDVIAVINGKALTKSDFRTFVNIRTGNRLQKGGLSQEQLQILLAEYINRELIYQEALQKGYDKIPEVATVIDNHRRNILASFSAQQIINHPISDEELRQAYNKYLAHPTLEYKTRHILVNSEDEARAIIKQLDQGADFAELAKARSIDASAKQGGSLDWFSNQDLIPPYRNAVAALKPGSYTKTPVQTKFGWHVILLEATREVPPPPFEAAKEKIRSLLQNEMLARHIETLRKQSKIEILQ